MGIFLVSILVGFSIFDLKASLPKVLSSQSIESRETQAQAINEAATPSAFTKNAAGVNVRISNEEKERTRAELKTRQAELQNERKVKREEFNRNLQKVRDENQQKRLTNVNEKLTQTNERWIAHWKNVLNRLNTILSKIKVRTEKLAENGKDTADIESALVSAEEAINSALLAVEVQSAKVYTINITSETTIKEDAKESITLLRADLKIVQESLQKARSAVVAALELMARVEK